MLIYAYDLVQLQLLKPIKKSYFRPAVPAGGFSGGINEPASSGINKQVQTVHKTAIEDGCTQWQSDKEANTQTDY